MRHYSVKKSVFLFLLALVSVMLLGGSNIFLFEKKPSLYATLRHLGYPKVEHEADTMDVDLVRSGYELVHFGRTIHEGEKSAPISRHFVCTSCHNVEREDPDLSDLNPEKRLAYVREKGLPFLQGTTFWGMVNRESWFNDDYEKKYGDLVLPAQKSLKGALQLCSKECSQGRTLEDWELDAMLAYLWTLEIKLADLSLPDSLRKAIEQKPQDDSTAKQLMASIQAFYPQKSPATFVDAYPDYVEAQTVEHPNPENGRMLFEQGCMHCHQENGVALFTLDDSPLTFAKFQRNTDKFNRFSLPQITRYGTSPHVGHKPYMPLFTKERMSTKQLADLMAYMELMASAKAE